MAAKMLFALAATLLCAGLASAATCATPSCPDGYYVVPGYTECGYTCATQLKLNCLPQPIYNIKTRSYYPPKPATEIQWEAAKPRVCGGYSDEICPAVACAYSASYAFSGPLGCSTASSYIKAYSVSKTDIDFQPYYYEMIKDYTDYYCTYGYSEAKLVAYASAAAAAYAKAVAYTYAQYNTYVCTCCKGNSVAYTEVKASMQAVATAIAQAIVEAGALVKDCNGKTLSVATASAEAVASATELAIAKVWDDALSFGGKYCGYDYMVAGIQTAVAKATACAFAHAIAQAVDSNTPDVTYSCSSDISISGDGYTQKCKPLYC